jgi:hypothetical protein
MKPILDSLKRPLSNLNSIRKKLELPMGMNFRHHYKNTYADDGADGKTQTT